MSAASNFLEGRVLDYWLKNNSLSSTSPSTVYVGLFTSDPSLGSTDENLEAGVLTNECTGGAYTRKSASFGSITNGSVSTDATITFPTASDNNWGTITHVAILDADQTDSAGQGNVLWYGRLDVAKLIESGDTFQITASSLTVTLA